MTVLYKLLLIAVVLGAPPLIVRLHFYVAYKRREREAGVFLSWYLDGIAALVASGQPNFHEFVTWQSGSSNDPQRSRTYRIFLGPSLAFVIGRDWRKGRWEYWASFFDPLRAKYVRFPSGVTLNFRSPWFEAKAEMLMRVLAAYHLRNGEVKEPAPEDGSKPAWPDLGVSDRTAASYAVFRTTLESYRSAA